MLWLLLLVAVPLVRAQNKNVVVTGAIVDSAQSPLIAATVVLLRKTDSVMHAFTITDQEGGFKFKKVPEGQYIMQVSYLGFRNMSKPLPAFSNSGILELGKVELVEANKLIDEISISADRIPIVIKGDTIEYNADAFKTQPNDVVEDLLKKLPGL